MITGRPTPCSFRCWDSSGCATAATTTTWVPELPTHIGVGERVSLANPGAEPAELIVVAAPPEFADALISWPTA